MKIPHPRSIQHRASDFISQASLQRHAVTAVLDQKYDEPLSPQHIACLDEDQVE